MARQRNELSGNHTWPLQLKPVPRASDHERGGSLPFLRGAQN